MAVELMANQWSLKQITKLMMMSSAYQMESAFDDEANAKADPENVYLWRFRPQRLDAEIVRDSILAASGGINLTIGGPPVFPPIPKELLTEANHGIWTSQADGPDVWRARLYLIEEGFTGGASISAAKPGARALYS
jgi:hypothetical protein